YFRFAQQKTPQEMNSRELFSHMKLLEQGGVATNALSTEFHLKYSIPMVSLVFALIGIPLSLPSIRGGKSWGIVLSVVIVFSFYVFASILRSLGRGGVIPPIIAAWTPNITFIIIGIGLLFKESYYK
ncbi:MAG: LptF/LptG family permease, partial [bacterium]